MKKMITMGIIGFTFCMLYASGTAQAGFMDAIKSGAPAKSAPAAGSALAKSDFDGLFKLADDADGLLGKSVNNLVQMVCNKDVADELNRKMKAAEEIKDPKEREAAISKVKEEQSAALLAASEKQETTEKLTQLNGEQKKLAANSMYNFILGGLMDKSAIELANGIVSKVQANPKAVLSYKDSVSRTKDLATSLPPQVSKIVQIGDNLIKLAKTSKIEVVVPKTATDAPKEVSL
jgi:hypothetical protein